MHKKKALMISLGSLGDILQATPIIQVLHQNNIAVSILTFDGNQSLFEFNPRVSHVFTVPKSAFGKIKLVFLVSKYSFDLIINTHRSMVIDFFMWVLRVPIRIGFDSIGKSTIFLTHSYVFSTKCPRHDLYLGLIQQWSEQFVDPHQSYPEFFPDPRVFLTIPKSNYIVVAPLGGRNSFSIMPTRVWPNYAQLIQAITNGYSNLEVVLVGDKADLNQLKQINQCLQSNKQVSIQVGSVHQLAILLQSATLFIGNDSFPLYMAVSQKCLSIGIFGPTDATVCLSRYSNVIHIQSSFSCSPCYNPLHGTKGIAYRCPYSAKCMIDISVNQVLDQIHKHIKLV